MRNKILLMGILNITPDSFSDGGDYYSSTQKAVKRTRQMLSEGTDIIDIGGESTRPGSEQVEAQEELRRVIPVIKAIKKDLPNGTLSIDTWKSKVAEEAIKNGCTLINSLGGFLFDPALVKVVAKNNCKIIIYHIKGQPKTMQKGDTHYNDVLQEIADFFEQQIAIGIKNGVKKEQFILDPGIGFGKSVSQNIEIIKRLKAFQKFNLPIAIGVSRKSHLGIILKDERGIDTKPTERLTPSLAETAIALQNGATIIRTHDIIETKKFITVLEKFL